MTQSQPYDARTGTGEPLTDPAAAGEVSAQDPDADGGAVPSQEQEKASQQLP